MRYLDPNILKFWLNSHFCLLMNDIINYNTLVYYLWNTRQNMIFLPQTPTKYLSNVVLKPKPVLETPKCLTFIPMILSCKKYIQNASHEMFILVLRSGNDFRTFWLIVCNWLFGIRSMGAAQAICTPNRKYSCLWLGTYWRFPSKNQCLYRFLSSWPVG